MNRLPKKILVFLAMSFYFYGCTTISKSPHNGFYFDRSNELSLGFGAFGVDSVALKRRVEFQGYFISITSGNGRSICLFIEGNENKIPDFKTIIAALDSNHPGNWQFYYTPWGGDDAALYFNYIDSTGEFVRLRSGFRVGLLSSYLESGSVTNIKRIKRYGYNISYLYTENTCFWLGVTNISKLNQANSGQRISWTARKNRFSRKMTGPKTNKPCYYFIDTKSDSMQILLPCSITEAERRF